VQKVLLSVSFAVTEILLYTQPYGINGRSLSEQRSPSSILSCITSEAIVRITRSRTERRPRLKCDGTRAETTFRLSAKRTSPFKSAGASVQSTTGSRGVRISGSNAGYTMFRGSVKSTGYPLHSPVSPSLPIPFVTVCHHISTGLYLLAVYPFTPQERAYGDLMSPVTV